MRKFSILHLSDLHITNLRDSYSPLLKKLIEDIAKESKKIDSLILIVTGDIVDKANYKNSLSVAVSFFEDLISKLANKVKRIYFTPGNHDKKRIDCHELIQEYFDGKSYSDLKDNFESGDWKNLFSHPFDDYIDLIKKISQKTNIDIITDLYYSDVFEINDCCVRINSINSTLTSFNDKDYGSLHIGEFQINKIESDFEKKKSCVSNKDIDVSITIMHHPLFWLCKEEYDDIQHFISSHDSLSTDVLLRGHTHNRSLENHYSLYNSFSTLVTGIGSCSSGDNHPQRYSIYTFKCDLNLIEIIMRSSSEKGFIPDYSAYVSETDESRKKIHFPIRVHEFFSDIYLKLPLVGGDFQPIFSTKEMFERITDYSEKLLKWKERLTNILFTYKSEFISHVRDNEGDSLETCESIDNIDKYLMTQGVTEFPDEYIEYIESILKKYKSNISELVNGILYDVCLEFATIFFNDTLAENERVRVQFRILNSKDHFSHEGLTNHSLNGNNPTADCGITPVPWGQGLIKESFKTGAPLIYSLNRNSITDRMEETEWKDYLTYAPNVPTNSYYYSKNRTHFPILTFGINSNSPCSRSTFETLSLLPLKSIIDDVLLDIHNSFNFSFESLIRKK